MLQRSKTGAYILALVWIIAGSLIPPLLAQDAHPPLHAQDHVLIKFKSEASTHISGLPPADALRKLTARLNLPNGTELHEPALNKIFRQQATMEPAGKSTTLGLDRFLYLSLPPGLTVEGCIARLQNHPLLEYVEPDGFGAAGMTIPNDPYYSWQWHHGNKTKPSASISTPAAWDITQGSNSVIVAVLDTGLNAALPEFSARTVAGYNFAYSNTNTDDDVGHGTAVAGTLCANANNSSLGVGVDWHCRLMPVKVLDQNNSGLYSWWAQGIDFAVRNGCKVINLSAGGSSADTTLTQAILNAIAHGVIFVTITHNDGMGIIRFPGSLTNCITVGATDALDRHAGFSNYGSQIDLVAPGTNIATVSTSGNLTLRYGTSFSAPLVSGVCALLAAVRPGITQGQAEALLCGGAEDGVGDDQDTPGFDNYYGWGRLNAFNSLLLAQTRVDQIQLTKNKTVQLSWQSPANASNKQPYQVDFRTSLASAWTSLNLSNGFSYSTNRTYWLDDGSLTGGVSNRASKFYRVRIRQL